MVSATREGAAEPRPHTASVTRTSWHQLHSPAQAPKEASPSTSLGQKQIPSPLKGVSLGKKPISSRNEVPPALAQPQQLQLLSQTWLGMEMCSQHRNSAPEPAFGYQPWVWFEILPEENVHPLAEPFSLRPWRKSPATSSNPSLSSSSSAHLPGEAQAAAP